MARPSATGREPRRAAFRSAAKYWNNKFTDLVTNGWNVEGILTFYYGTPMTINCSANGAPIGYWTGTPTGGIPFRCQILEQQVHRPGDERMECRRHSHLLLRHADDDQLLRQWRAHRLLDGNPDGRHSVPLPTGRAAVQHFADSDRRRAALV